MSAWTKEYWPRFGTARVGLEDQDLPADEGAQARLEFGLGDPRHRRQPGQGEALAEDGGIRDQRPVVCREPVEPARDQRGEGLGDGQRRQVADRAIHPVVDRQAALGDEHPDGLDGVQRDPAGALEDRRHGRRRKPGHEPGQQLAHRRLGQGLEVERGEVALAGTPVRALLEQVGTCQGDDVDRDVPAPLEKVVDEVEQARVGVVVILEDEHDRRRRGEALEERPPGGEELLRSSRSRPRPRGGRAGPARSSAAPPRRGRAPRASRRSSLGSSARRRSRGGRLAAGPSRRAPRS